MSDEWYYEVLGEKFGPITGKMLQEAVAAGTVTGDTQVMYGPAGNWVFASQVQGLIPQPTPQPQRPSGPAPQPRRSAQPRGRAATPPPAREPDPIEEHEPQRSAPQPARAAAPPPTREPEDPVEEHNSAPAAVLAAAQTVTVPKKYPNLRIIAGLFLALMALNFFVSIVLAVGIVLQYEDDQLPIESRVIALLVLLAETIVVSVVLFAVAESIRVFLDIEHNARRGNRLQEVLIELLQQDRGA